MGTKYAKFIEQRYLKRGINLDLDNDGNPDGVDRVSVSAGLYPLIRYDGNANGGNPDKPLIIGNIEFLGDEERYRVGSSLFGLGGFFSARQLFRPDRYVDFNFSAQYTLNPHRDIEVLSANMSLCSENRIKGWWYLDLCGKRIVENKEFDDSRSSEVLLRTSRISSDQRGNTYQLYLSAERRDEDLFHQMRYGMGLNAALSSGSGVGIHFLIGEPVHNQLALRSRVGISLGFMVFEKPLTLSLERSFFGGGQLLGIGIEEDRTSIAISYPLSRSTNLSISFEEIDNTLSYFDGVEPNLSLNFVPLRF